MSSLFSHEDGVDDNHDDYDGGNVNGGGADDDDGGKDGGDVDGGNFEK